jgi:leucyl aminopeptidase
VIQFRPSPKFDQAATLVFLTKEQVKSNKISHQDHRISHACSLLAQSKSFNGDSGQIFPFLDKILLLFVGLGEESQLSLRSLRITVRQALRSAYLKEANSVEIVPPNPTEDTVKSIIEGFLIGTYSWQKYKTVSKDKPAFQIKSLYVIATKKNLYEDCIKICSGVTLTRDLINENADVVDASYVEETVKDLVKGQKHVSLEILGRKEMKAKGLNLHLAVNQGSRNEPKLIIVKYSEGLAKEPYTALIGKGMTFDTGGLNLKPTGHIETMRCDMSGAAAVVGILKNAIALKLKKNILFVMGMAENVTGSGSYKPGDVFKSYNGMTVEIGNTDAEGRLVLADAISYVVRNYKPKKLIDIATLTGACVVALGHDFTGLVTTDDKFSRELVHCSNVTDDPVWRLPSYPELKEAVRSKIADIKNLGFPRGAGGTITAAEFLRQFTEDTVWAHLDIAGTAFVDGDSRLYYSHGATGAGVRLLTEYIKSH